MSQVDVDRHGPTYTVDTLSDLAAQFRDHELFFITGADALAQILSWQRVGELFALAHLVGVTRPGFRLDDAHLPDGTVSLVEVPAMGSPPPTVGAVSARGYQSGTWCPTARSSTPTSGTCTATRATDRRQGDAGGSGTTLFKSPPRIRTGDRRRRARTGGCVDKRWVRWRAFGHSCL